MEITTKTGSTAILALTTAFYISASLSPTSIMTIDWGDGATTTKSNANVSVHEHTYADYGKFVVTFSINDDTKYTIGNGYVNSAVVGGTNNYLRTALKKCFVGRNATVNNYAFNSCSYLDKITLGNTTNSSGNSFLSACKNLKYVVVPRSMTSLSSGLGSCYNLEFISLHPDVTEADYIATSNYKLKSLIYHRKIKTIVNTGGIHSLERLVVPFLGRTSTDSTTNYISYLFGNHDTSGGMEDDNTKYVPSTLKKITIMDGSNIRASAFKGCTNLIISIVNDAKLPSYAFANINNLVTVTFPKTITSLSSYLFQNTFGLKEIALPNSVTTSTSTLFQGCQNLEKVIVSKNSKNYNSSFSNCVALKIVIFDIDIPPTIGSLDFQTSFNVKIYVPDANVDAYKVATNWVLFANSIYPISVLNEEDKQWLSEQNR